VGFYLDESWFSHVFIFYKGDYMEVDLPGEVMDAWPHDISNSGQIAGTCVMGAGDFYGFLLRKIHKAPSAPSFQSKVAITWGDIKSR
jgi:hypothetical protein